MKKIVYLTIALLLIMIVSVICYTIDADRINNGKSPILCFATRSVDVEVIEYIGLFYIVEQLDRIPVVPVYIGNEVPNVKDFELETRYFIRLWFTDPICH